MPQEKWFITKDNLYDTIAAMNCLKKIIEKTDMDELNKYLSDKLPDYANGNSIHYKEFAPLCRLFC